MKFSGQSPQVLGLLRFGRTGLRINLGALSRNLLRSSFELTAFRDLGDWLVASFKVQIKLVALLAVLGFLSTTHAAEAATPPPLASCAGNPPGYVDFNFSTIINDSGAGTGRTWTYENATSYLGESIDINIEVLSLVGTDDFDSISGSSTKANTVMKSLSKDGDTDETEAEIRWSFVRSSDQTPIAISAEVEFGDIDLRTSRLESILVNRADYDGYGVIKGAEIDVSSDGFVDRFDGKIDGDNLPTQAVKFTLHNRTDFTWRQRMDRRGTGSSGRAGFDAKDPPFQVDNCPRYDFSDADGVDEARHNAFSQMTLGSDIDTEFTAQTDATASGDGADDDGVTIPELMAGETATITADVTGAGGFLQGWIDFNGDGDFDDTGEQVAADLQLAGGTSGIINVPVTVPSDAVTTQTFARFRWSTTSGLNATTAAPDGEVEDYAVTVTLPAGPAFPPGPGLSASVCSVDPATNPFQDIGLRWEFNGGNPEGTSPSPSIDRGDIFASATVGSYVGINAQINNSDLNIDADSIPAVYNPNSYIEYQFTTSAFTNHAELTGFGQTLFGRRPNPPNQQATGAYRFAIAVDDDPSFASPDVLINDVQFNGADTSTAAAATNPRDAGTYIQTFAHWDANGTTVSLSPNTTYTMRVFPYAVTEFGDDNGQPFTNIVLWDDFMPKAVSCTVVVDDLSDAPTSGTAPDGSSTVTYGEAQHTVVAGLQLGGAIDADGASIANADASGDGADDDGVGLPTSLTPGSTITVPVSASGSGFLNAWIDWNGNGIFDSIEQVATDVQDLSGLGAIDLLVTVPSDALVGTTFARFRWSSDFNIGPSGYASNGEVEDYQIAIGGGGTMLSGRVFIDNGLGGVIAHDGQIAGNEQSGAFGSIALLDGSGNPLATATVNPDGTWTGTLPAGYSGTVQVVTVPSPGYRTISEDRSTLPGVVNASETDGTYSFTAAAGSNYTGMNIGVVADPTLTQNQTASVIPGQTTDLPHVYTATTSGTVTFGLVDQFANPDGAFTSTVFEDVNCDGTPNQFLAGPKAVSVGQQICLVVSTQASAGVNPNASYSYGITASTAFTGTTEIHLARNDDAIGAGTGQELVLRKLVTNLTKASGEGTTNTGDIGDVLRYRIVMSNPSSEAAADVVVYDETPAYTALNGPVPSPITLANGVTCALSVPASNVAGYTGPLQWNCPGSFPPGGEGSLTFDVQISP